MIGRTAALYLLIFVGVLVALDAGAYAFLAREYTSLLQPALGTPEGAAAWSLAMRRVALTIAAIDLPLLIVVALASYALARATLAPLLAARERERRFCSDAAHELRSPLAAIAATAQTALLHVPPAEREPLERIASEALDASAIVTDLLTLARDPRRSALVCEPVDLAAVVMRCARDAATMAAPRVAVEPSAQSAIVDGDERRLREMTRNLIDNAVRHARTRVIVGSHSNGRTCSIVVEDDGSGIAPEDRERVFERFFHRGADDAGTGLGLPIARWIARAHRGTLEIADATGSGARFVATFPSHAG